MKTHKVACKGEKLKEKVWECSWEGCLKSFQTADSMRAHVAAQHTFTPKPCSRCPDKLDVLYKDINQWRRHSVAEHDELEEPMLCSVGGCINEDRLWTRFGALKDHLRSYHLLPGEERDKLMPKRDVVRPPAMSF
jgi:hypothetical protein